MFNIFYDILAYAFVLILAYCAIFMLKELITGAIREFNAADPYEGDE